MIYTFPELINKFLVSIYIGIKLMLLYKISEFTKMLVLSRNHFLNFEPFCDHLTPFETIWNLGQIDNV